MDEELWLDYYYRKKEDPEPDQDNDLEPEIDQEKEAEPEQSREEIKCQGKEDLENKVQIEIEPRQDQNQEKQNQHQEHHERKRWGREHDRRSRVTGRTCQRSQQTPPLQREIKKEVPRRLSPTDQIIQLAVSAIRQLENPDQRKKSIYFGKVYDLKSKDKLATSTAKKYEREAKTLRSLKEQYSNEEMFTYIINLAVNKSRSTYFRQKAILERILSDQEEATGDRSGIGLLRMLRHMPDYHRIRHIFGMEVEKSKETDKRRNCKIGWEAVKAYTSVIHSPAHPNMQLVPLILYFTGARISELRDLRIFAEPNGELTVKIKSKKTGCASRASKERTVRLRDKDFCEWLISDGIGTTSTEPFKDIPSNTARNALLSARRKLARKSIDVPSPHYFRHNYATMRRAAGVDNEQLRKELGHTNQETTRQYGGGNFHQ